MSPLLLTSLFSVVEKISDKLWPDPDKKAQAQLELLKMQQSGELAQLEADTRLAEGQLRINEAEAKSEGVFKGGWRPATGWICAAGLGYQVLISPILGWVAANLWDWKMPPALDMETLMALLFGMLGLGAYRSFEKIKNK